jgi:hypothetical protein
MINVKITYTTGFSHTVNVLPNNLDSYVKFLKTLNAVEKYEIVLTKSKGITKKS